MCGIISAVAQRDVCPLLIEGLKRLEYRGYDSAGIVVVNEKEHLVRVRKSGKVADLESSLDKERIIGRIGIAHTRWATHGTPSEINAHPHVSGERVAIVHNGVIENHQVIRGYLKEQGYHFISDTDTEVIVHLIHYELQQKDNMREAIQNVVRKLQGSYAVVAIDRHNPNEMIAVRSGSPLVIGLGIGENFIASDQLALLPVTSTFIFLNEGDVALISRESISIYNGYGLPVDRDTVESKLNFAATEKGSYRHFMLKEIYEQPESIASTLENRIVENELLLECFDSEENKKIVDAIEAIQIVACGTSYHAGLVARNWFEDYGIPCRIEEASEFRFRKPFVPNNCLFITISQSGETADTLAALRTAKENGFFASLAICNVEGSALVRESDLVLMTRAGVEIGVASTKAFTTQLVTLLMLVVSIAEKKSKITTDQRLEIIKHLRFLPHVIRKTLDSDNILSELSEHFADKNHALFLGRGTAYPIAMEGALKLKEVSYIHAEAYAAGELKHGPLALVDSNMPVIVVAPNNELLEKLKSNMEEVRTRNGKLYVFSDRQSRLVAGDGVEVILLDEVHEMLSPIVYSVPLQLLAYYVAVIKGTDVDQPRNLAKSVTV